MNVDPLVYIISAVVCFFCLLLFPYVGVVLVAGLALLALRERWEWHIYQPGKFEPPLCKKIGFIAILHGTPATDPVLNRFVGMLGGKAYETPEGIVTQIGGVAQPWPDVASAFDGMKRLVTERRQAAELREPAEKAAVKKERAEKRRPIKQLALWYALCWVVVAVWIRLLGGRHGDWGYSRARHFFWWDSFEVAGIVWFATTLLYSILPRPPQRPPRQEDGH